MNNTCICCGEIIPEGRQVCPTCENQIEEMAQTMANIPPIKFPYGSRLQGKRIFVLRQFAKALYEANYLKQSRGEWKQAYNSFPRYVCTNCNHLFNNKTFKYCPNCGAKMKGGAG